MESKKQARTLQKAAKEFGYEIKLTHAQEILAKVKGFENRHALFENDTKVTLIKKDQTFYYEICVLLEKGQDYSKYLSSPNKLSTEQEIVTEALDQDILDVHEWNRVHYTEEISEAAYQKAMKEKMFYYEVHVFLSRKEGFSKYFASTKRLLTEEDIITEAINTNILDNDDAKYVDYTEEIPESEYKEVMNY